jgi:hypothetical protein
MRRHLKRQLTCPARASPSQGSQRTPNAPLGRGCYDSMISAIAVHEMLDRAPHCADEANAAPSILWWSIRGAAEERQGCKPTDPRSRHGQWRVSRLRGAAAGAGAIAIHGRRFLRNKTTTRKIATVAAIKAPVRISSRERPTPT